MTDKEMLDAITDTESAAHARFKEDSYSLRGSQYVIDTLRLYLSEPKFTKGRRLTSMREVYEALLAGHKIKNSFTVGDYDSWDIFWWDDNVGAKCTGCRKQNLPLFDECEWWEILE